MVAITIAAAAAVVRMYPMECRYKYICVIVMQM